MTTTEIEKRLSFLEREMASLKATHTGKSSEEQHPVQTLEATHGTFQDDQALKDAMRLGQKWRHSLDRKPHRRSKAKRK